MISPYSTPIMFQRASAVLSTRFGLQYLWREIILEQQKKPSWYGLIGCLLFFAVFGVSHAAAEVAPRTGLSVALFPVRNVTEVVVWGSKYYPGDVLPEKLGSFFRQLLKDAPLVAVRDVLPEVWLSEDQRREDFGVALEIYRFEPRRKEILGTTERGVVSLRMVVYDGLSGEERYRTVINARDARWTPEYRDPSSGSMPIWEKFSQGPFWSAFQTAAREARDDLLRGYTGYAVMGRLLSPLADSTKEHRTYIVSLGKYDSLRVGDILGVARSDRYITVDPENPVVVMPRLVGKVRVDFLKPREATVTVVEEHPEDPIQLKDLVVLPLYAPRKGSW